MSIRRLAKRTGLCASALYKSYPSRSALLNTVAADAWISFTDDLRRHEHLRPAAARFNAMAQDAIDFALANPHLWQLMVETSLGYCPITEMALRHLHKAIDLVRSEEPGREFPPANRCAEDWLAHVFGSVALYRMGLTDEEILRENCARGAGRVVGLA